MTREPAESFIRQEDLVDILEDLLRSAGASEPVARILAENCVGCERDGSLSHGVFRVPGYLSALRGGWADGRAVPRISAAGSSFFRVDAAWGFAQVALEAARPALEQALRETGVAVAAIRDSLHFSALWPDLEEFARQGYVGLTMVTGGPAVIPPGATERVYGTNPIAFATPTAEDPPLIFDMATSSMSQGDLLLEREAGRAVPEGTGLGREGRATHDPAEILDEGGLLPFGGHKGALLSLMVEILASGLTGGAFSYQKDLVMRSEGEPRRTGQLLLLLDPARGGNEGYAERITGLLAEVRRAGVDRFPGDRRYEARELAERRGIPVTPAIRDLLETHARGG